MRSTDLTQRTRQLAAALGRVTRQEHVLMAAEKRLCAYIMNNAQHRDVIQVDSYLKVLISEVEKERDSLLKLKDMYFKKLEQRKEILRGD